MLNNMHNKHYNLVLLYPGHHVQPAAGEDPGAGSAEMTYYQQTLLIPAPTQNLRDMRTDVRPRGRGSTRGYGNRRSNSDLNSILAFFE